MFRPAGSLEWSLACSRPRKWYLFGSINSETRSLETAKVLCRLGVMDDHRILCIEWPASPYSENGERATSENVKSFRTTCGEPNVIERSLLASVPDFRTDAEVGAASVILDITSMPKRFFFYYLKNLLRDDRIKDLIVTYCTGKYGQGSLSGNHEDWDVLPTFRGSSRLGEATAQSRLAVNVGFMPEGLEEHLRTDDSEKDLFLILPFPARVSSIRRVWKSAMEIHNQWHGESSIHIRRVAPDDISGAFDLICRIANGNPLSLAPFGPKPISAAMCIYACLTDSPVYYAQPKWYSPEYTTGVEYDDRGEPLISAHWIKHDGTQLYQL